MLALASVATSIALSGVSVQTALRITYWPQGQERGNPISRTLRCAPARGTMPNAGQACRRLFALQRPFAPVPEDTVCTQIYGGPQGARVTGTFRGRRIWAAFRRNDGCEIARWNRHAFLFPAG